jgi:malonyl CoA-acyl carrier protein transacylase
MLKLALPSSCSFEDGLKLVKLRGESMQAASDASPSGMVSVIGLDAEKVHCQLLVEVLGAYSHRAQHMGWQPLYTAVASIG